MFNSTFRPRRKARTSVCSVSQRGTHSMRPELVERGTTLYLPRRLHGQVRVNPMRRSSRQEGIKNEIKKTRRVNPMFDHEGTTNKRCYLYNIRTSGFSLYKSLFHFKALLRESIIPLLPPHLQSLPCCDTIGRPLRNIRPPTDPSFVCHTPYHIGDGNIL